MRKNLTWITDSMRLRAFASTGWTVEDIAERLEMNEDYVAIRIKEMGYPVKHSRRRVPVMVSREPDAKEGPEEAKPKKPRVIGRNLPANKRQRILQLRKQGMTYQKIANEIGMSYSFVWGICHA
ncbi:MAG: hypothetical protein IJ737_08140 [Ruminococcus sp.]|nr:hypothetical protein [Ruminococcus sp.]